MVAIAVALILAVTVIAAVLLTRPQPAPEPTSYEQLVEDVQAQKVACLEGGGEWVFGPIGTNGHCEH